MDGYEGEWLDDKHMGGGVYMKVSGSGTRGTGRGKVSGGVAVGDMKGREKVRAK